MSDTMLKEARFSIAGMRCGGCAIALEKRLRQTPGVSAARVNATTHGLIVRFDAGALSARQIEAVVGAAGYAAHPDNSAHQPPEHRAGVLAELAVAGFGMMNVMLFSVAVWSGLTSDMGAATVQFMNRAAAALATPVIFFAARPFYGPAFAAITSRRMTMDVAISFAIFGTYFASLIETMNGRDHVYFDAAIALTFFLLVGRQLDHMLRRRSSTAAKTLRTLIRPDCQRIRADGTSEQVSVKALTSGDIVFVPRGERAPADGVLLSGQAAFDESILTGESAAATKQAGDTLFAGTLNLGDPCRFRVEQAGKGSSLEQVSRLIDQASAEKGQRQQFADRFAASYGPFVLISAALAFSFWFFALGADVQRAFEIAVAVLVVTCPCAAGLATPAVASRAANLLLEKGVIVKSGAALEALAIADQFVCDKTGTLSVLQPLQHKPDGAGADRLSALARASSHPVARAIAPLSSVAPAFSVCELPGQGLRDDQGNALGSAEFVGASGAADSAITGPEIWFRQNGQAPARIALSEQPRDGLKGFVNDLRADGTNCLLLSGDRPPNVTEFARRNGISCAEGACKPDGKLHRIQALQAEGRVVAMLGDGINDAAALSTADVSLSFGEASEVARNAADIIIVGSSLMAIPQTRKMAKVARRRMTENLTFAALYNVATVPVAIAGLLTPFWAAIFMSSSSVLVMLNACRMRPLR